MFSGFMIAFSAVVQFWQKFCIAFYFCIALYFLSESKINMLRGGTYPKSWQPYAEEQDDKIQRLSDLSDSSSVADNHLSLISNC